MKGIVGIVSKDEGLTLETSALPFYLGGITYFINSFDYPNFSCERVEFHLNKPPKFDASLRCL